MDVSVSTESLLFENFDSPYRKDRTNHGGGVMLYISDDLLHTRRPELEIYCDESIWVEVKARKESFLLGIFYSPRASDVNFFDGLNRNIEKAQEISLNIIIVGDLNEDLFNPNFHCLNDIMLMNSLTNVVKCWFR